ncbi:ABC transporter permease [Algoriphagus sp. NG3]|uniref:ABC transporter permease n=1 Tax=Algoriphagus sp. NG3 TaxID=3097546 RepID=UPI002A821FEE|nr:ABC transporter permease [Algoriphagus sp. NG3]WPR77742.1 ABC transporter permease [Algoriphagus sp. NG3]
MGKKEIQPPGLAQRFFRWFCDKDLLASIEGDLFELYHERLQKEGKFKADLRFIRDVLLLFRPGIIGIKNKEYKTNHIDMFRNNFKIARRTLWKNKPATIINMLGLIVGITSCMLIALFIQHEMSYDTFQHNADRIGRVVMEYSFDGSEESSKGTFTSTKVAPVLSRTFPEVEKAIRMNQSSAILQLEGNPVTEAGFMYADSTFFDAFAFEMIQGNPTTALNGPRKVVLTESMAKKYFGEANPVGQGLEVGDDKTIYEVTGVMEDYPYNSQFRFDFLASFSSMGMNQEESYWNANYTTYLLLQDESSFGSMAEKLPPFMEKETADLGATINFTLEHFDRVHLYSPYSDFVPNTNIKYLYMLAGIALLILVIVCFTYINLSTARSMERAKEVGIRKVSGAGQSQLFWQFIGESFLLCGLSVVASFIVVYLVLPSFNNLIGRELILEDLLSPTFLTFTLGLTLGLSLIAGAYPAIFLSKFQPMKVLKGVFKNTSSAKWLQQSLTVFQFGISVFLIIATLVVQGQLNYIQSRDLGYDREHIVSLPIGWNTDFQKINTLKKELKASSQIIEVSRAASSPVNINSGYSMNLPTRPENEVISVNANPVDENFIAVAGLEVIAGTDFTEQHIRQTEIEPWEKKEFHYIMTESAADKFGWTPEEAIGKEMILNQQGTVVGVVKDFHFQSLRNDLQPLVLFSASWGGRLLVKINGENIPESLGFIENTWSKILPERPYSYRFLDEDYDRMYQSEMQLGKLMNLFSTCAIVLACLGLFGLSSYMIQQRLKEVSIRKVLGASTFQVLNILSGNFVRLVLIAIVLASPIAYYTMSSWLDDFAFHISAPWWAVMVAAILTLAIGLITAGIHGLKAALSNPVNSLKSE